MKTKCDFPSLKKRSFYTTLVDPEYRQGFNAGYLLAQHDPEKLKILLKETKEDVVYVRGIRAGRTETPSCHLYARAAHTREQ